MTTQDASPLWTAAAPIRWYIQHSPIRKGKGFLAARLLRPILPPAETTYNAQFPEDRSTIVLKFGEDIGFQTAVFGDFERGERRALRRLAKPGTTAIDVGANVGIHTVTLSRAVGHSGRVIAFEPEQQNFWRLTETLTDNSIDNVVALRSAIADAVGEAELQLTGDNAYASLVSISSNKHVSGTATVPVTTLDTFWTEARPGKVSVIKIDVEGAELQVLQGAERLLTAECPALLIECRTNEDHEKVDAWLQARGYRERWIPGCHPWNHLYLPVRAKHPAKAATADGQRAFGELGYQAEAGYPGVCVLCGGGKFQPVFEGTEERFGLGGRFLVARCRSCTVVSTRLPDRFPLQDWYDRAYWNGHEAAFGAIRLRGENRDRLLLKLQRIWRKIDGNIRPEALVHTGRVLEVGCGPGYDAEEMERNGACCIGLDTTRRGLQDAAERGLHVVQATLDRAPFAPCSFDVVVMSQVLEHLSDPREALQSAMQLLRPGGRLIVMLPNIKSAQRSWFGSHWANWHLPYHLWHFDANSLRRLVEDAGFTIATLSTNSPGTWFLQSLALRFPRARSLVGRRTVSWSARIAVAPVLRALDMAGRGDNLVLQARRGRAT